MQQEGKVSTVGVDVGKFGKRESSRSASRVKVRVKESELCLFGGNDSLLSDEREQEKVKRVLNSTRGEL